MQFTVDVPDDLALELRPLTGDLSRILQLGLQAYRASSQQGYEGNAAVLELLANLPTPEEVLALRPNPSLEARIQWLLQKNRDEGLTSAEQAEWKDYEYLEHLVRVAKINAATKLRAS